MSASNKFGAGMGVKRLTLILDNYPDILNTKNNIVNLIKNIDGFEEKTARIFADNINLFKNFIKNKK